MNLAQLLLTMVDYNVIDMIDFSILIECCDDVDDVMDFLESREETIANLERG